MPSPLRLHFLALIFLAGVLPGTASANPDLVGALDSQLEIITLHLEQGEARQRLAASGVSSPDQSKAPRPIAQELHRQLLTLRARAQGLEEGSRNSLLTRLRHLETRRQNLELAIRLQREPPVISAQPKGLGGITGTVISNADGPLAGAEVVVFDTFGFGVATATTGPGGTYLAGGLEDGVYFALAMDPVHLDQIFDGLPCQDFCDPTVGTAINVGPALVEGIDFQLDLGGTLTGQVRATGSGEPLQSLVDLYDSAGNLLRSASTDSNGVYTLSGLDAATYLLKTLNFEGFQDQLYEGIPCNFCAVGEGDPIQVTLSQTTTIDFELERKGAIAGTVRLAGSGAPLDFALIEIYDQDGNFANSGTTFVDGTYEIGGLSAGTYFARTNTTFSTGQRDELYDDLPCVDPCDVTTGTPISVQADQTTAGIDFDLEDQGKISGTVGYADTPPQFLGTTVAIWDESGAFVEQLFLSGDASAEYSTRGLPDGTYFMSASSFPEFATQLYDGIYCPEIGFDCLPTSGTPVIIAEGQDVPGIDFTLNRLGVVTGQVSDAVTGRPLANAILLLQPIGSTDGFTIGTNAGGSYVFNNLPPGTYTARADLDGYGGEIFKEITPCTLAGCNIIPFLIEVDFNSVATGIDFTLTREGATDPGPPIDPRACQLDVQPAATLLFPYFEVERGNPAGLTTLISLNNAAAEPHVAQVTLWTDWGEPSLAFSVYLTGYDVQTINLRDIFSAGILPSTGTNVSNQGSLSGDNASFPGCTDASTPGSSPAFPNPALDGATRAHLQAWHSGEESPMTGTCAGSPQDGRWTGYVTVDAARECSDKNPSDFRYFIEGGNGVATNANVLFGDYFFVTSEEDFAQGEPAVHLRADREAFTAGSYSFYGRHAFAQDDRQPLGSSYAFRYLNGGAFTGGTELIVWRDSKFFGSNEVACGNLPDWAPLPTVPILAFDEEENPQTLPTETSPFPAMTQRVPVGGQALPTVADFGWMWLDLAHSGSGRYGDRAQGYVLGMMNALGRFSVGFRATRIAGVCEQSMPE